MRPIDADELFDRIFAMLDDTKIEVRAVGKFMDLVNTAPTIAPPPNDPLTLEELREMEWEPVWAESLANPDVRCWGYHCQNSVICSHGYCGFFLDDEYGKTWLAYRRKPEEAQT